MPGPIILALKAQNDHFKESATALFTAFEERIARRRNTPTGSGPQTMAITENWPDHSRVLSRRGIGHAQLNGLLASRPKDCTPRWRAWCYLAHCELASATTSRHSLFHRGPARGPGTWGRNRGPSNSIARAHYASGGDHRQYGLPQVAPLHQESAYGTGNPPERPHGLFAASPELGHAPWCESRNT